MFVRDEEYSLIYSDSSPINPFSYIAEKVFKSFLSKSFSKVETILEESSPPLRHTPTGTSLLNLKPTAELNVFLYSSGLLKGIVFFTFCFKSYHL